jgi:hypothetical protein
MLAASQILKSGYEAINETESVVGHLQNPYPRLARGPRGIAVAICHLWHVQRTTDTKAAIPPFPMARRRLPSNRLDLEVID